MDSSFLSSIVLLQLLNRGWQCVYSDTFPLLDDLSTADTTSQCVKKGRRRGVASDALGVYKLPPERGSLLNPPADGIMKNMYAAWRWLWDGIDGESGIGKLTDLEFSMYLHHQQHATTKPTGGCFIL